MVICIVIPTIPGYLPLIDYGWVYGCVAPQDLFYIYYLKQTKEFN